MTSNVWRCRKCQATDVPLNGRDQPESWHKCVFGVAVGSPHQWERLTDPQWQKLRDTAAKKKEKQNANPPLQTHPR